MSEQKPPKNQAKPPRKKFIATPESLIKSRVKKEIRSLSAYSVPHIDCPVKLDGNESPFSPPDVVLETVIREIRETPINRYPDAEIKNLREKIADLTGFPFGGILVGNGSDELIEMLMKTFSGKTGRILYPTPTFSMYRIAAATLGLKTVPVELDGNFDIDLDATLTVIREKNPDLIFLASPNNPTGNNFSHDKITRIISRSKGIVVMDEAYSDFCEETHLPLVAKYPNLVVLRTLSKIGFAGIRLGILFAEDALVREINKVRMPYNVNSLSQRAAEIALDNFEFVRENVQLIIRERERVFKNLREVSGVMPFPTDANFVLMRVRDADDVFQKLIERGILVRNFNSPGRLENCLRVTVGAPEENDAFLAAMREILKSSFETAN